TRSYSNRLECRSKPVQQMQSQKHKRYYIGAYANGTFKLVLQLTKIAGRILGQESYVFMVDFRNPKIYKMQNHKSQNCRPTVNHISTHPRRICSTVIAHIRYLPCFLVLYFQHKTHNKMEYHTKN